MKSKKVENKTAFKVGEKVWEVWWNKDEYEITAIKAYPSVIDITVRRYSDEGQREYNHVFAENYRGNHILLSRTGSWCATESEADEDLELRRIKDENSRIAEAVRTLAKQFKK